jgi:1-phosphofructokinase family hexose kinase
MERPLIATVTLNPACDQAVTVERLELGVVNRCQVESFDPGGKGLNASRVIHRLGRPTLALGYVGGVTGAFIRERLDVEGVPHELWEVAEPTRLNVMVRETESGRRTRIYGPGARVPEAMLDLLRARLGRLPPGSLVILAGSLPPGLPDTTYRDLIGWLRDLRLPTVLDASGGALAAALGARPALVKPNAEEAASLLGCRLDHDDAALSAAEELRRRGAEQVVISLGERGAVAVGEGGQWKAVPPWVNALSTVGSGDSMVAGLAIGLFEGSGLVEALRLGAAAGAATATTRGTQLCAPEDVRRLLPRVVVTPFHNALARGVIHRVAIDDAAHRAQMTHDRPAAVQVLPGGDATAGVHDWGPAGPVVGQGEPVARHDRSADLALDGPTLPDRLG